MTVCDANALTAAVFQVAAGQDTRKVIFKQGEMSSAGTLVMHFGDVHFDMFSLMDENMRMQLLLPSVMVADVFQDLTIKLQSCNSSLVRVTEIQGCFNLRVANGAFTEADRTALRKSKHKLSDMVVEMGRLVVGKQDTITQWQADFVLLSASVGGLVDMQECATDTETSDESGDDGTRERQV